jgi:hypothetical protein
MNQTGQSPKATTEIYPDTASRPIGMNGKSYGMPGRQALAQLKKHCKACLHERTLE